MIIILIDREIKVWSLDLDTELETEELTFGLQNCLIDHTGSIHGLAIAPQQNILISGSFDRTVKQWDLSTGNLLYNCVNDNEGINDLAINEQINLLVAGGDDGAITMWRLGSEEQVGLLLGNDTPLIAIAISHSGELIAGGCGDGRIKIWQLPTTDFSVYLEIIPWRNFNAHGNAQVTSLAFSNDDKLLYSTGADGFVRIWRLDTYEEIGHLKISDDDRILSLSLNDDDNLLAVGGSSGTVKVWQKNEVIYEDEILDEDEYEEYQEDNV